VNLANGIRIHFREIGSEHAAHTIIFCHGWPDFSLSWSKQMSFLSANGFRCIAPDLRGFGKSSAPEPAAAYTFKNIASDLAGLMDHLKLEKAIFIGHDWGGAAVWRMSQWYPNRVEAVCSICTPFKPRSPKFMPLADVVEKLPVFYYQLYFNMENGKLAQDELEKDIPRTISCIFRKSNERVGKWMDKNSKGLLEGYPAIVPRSTLLSDVEFNQYVDAFSQSGFRGGLNFYKTSELNWIDEENLSQEIKHQALMVTAGKDIVLSPALTEGMEKWIPNLKRAHVEEAGHWVTHEQPDQLNSILLQWLQQLFTSKL